MIYVTTNDIPGKKISKVIGVVRGSTVRAKWIGADLIAGLRNIFGGEITEYSNLLDEAREQALTRMISDAAKVKADAIVGVRFMTSTVGQGASEIMVYGTAVKVK